MLNRKIIIRVATSILVVTWMIVVFIFSSQDGTQTLNTSGAFIHAIESTIDGQTQVESHITDNETDINTSMKYKYSDEVQKIVRKNAHCILYMIGGVIISVFFTAFEYKKSRIMPLTISTGFLYAVSDEVHQKFVSGRTSSITDVAIDTIGVIIGTMLSILILNIIERKRINGGVNNVTIK